MTPELSVIIPMYRESKRIAETLRDATAWLSRGGARPSEIVLVDDGSDDGTVEVVLRRVTDRPAGSLLRVKLVRHEKNRGKGAAVRTGLLAAGGRWRLIMDADNSARVAEVEKLFAAARRPGVGLVCGSRRVVGARVEYGGQRGLMSGVFQGAVRALGYRFVRDTQCGFKLYRADAAAAITAAARQDRFAFDLEHLLLADRLGFGIAEVGIEWTHAEGGTVRPVRDGLRMLAAAVAIRGRVARLERRGEVARLDRARRERGAFARAAGSSRGEGSGCGACPCGAGGEGRRALSVGEPRPDASGRSGVRPAGSDDGERPVRRWVLLLLAVGLAACFGFFAYKVYTRTTGAGKEGDFRYFYYAAGAVANGEDPYGAGERAGDKNGYIYPPLFAVASSPLGTMERRTAERVWAAINAVLVGATLVLGFRVLATRLGAPTDAVAAMACMLLALVLTGEQTRWVIEQGQTDPLILLGFTLALAWLDRRPLLAGGALGFVANIKYQSLIALPYLFGRRSRAALAAVVSAGVIAALPALVVGWGRNIEYLSVAMGSLGKVLGVAAPERNLNIHDMKWINSVSIPSAVARGMDGAIGAAMAAVVALIAAATLGAVWVVYRARGVPLFAGRWGKGESAGAMPGVVAIEWCGLIVALLAFSPQAMVRHGYLLLLVHLAAAVLLVCARPGVSRWPLIAGLVLEQLGTKLPPGDDKFRAALDAWRGIGGSSWCYLVMFLTLLWTGLGWVRAPARGVGLSGAPSAGAVHA